MGQGLVVMFNFEVIDEYYGLTWDKIVLIPVEQDMVLIVQMLYGGGGHEVGEKYEYNKLTRSL